MPKVKNTKHKVQIDSLPKGFELVDGELVKKSHGGHVTGDQYNYGLTTFNTHADQSTGPSDTDVRYSLSSVPRNIANIEAEGGETVLTDLNNDGQFGLYDITGPRHTSGGVPMFLPEQSFIFSDTQKMKMGREMLADHGIQSRKKMTPAKVSKQYDLNKYYGILNDEYADKIQANTADLMLQKNKEGLSKLAFGQEMMKGFEEGLPLAAYPYVQSIGIDPFEFAQKVEGLQQFAGDQQAQPMNEADMQAMNPMAAYGKELVEAQGGTELNALESQLPNILSEEGVLESLRVMPRSAVSLENDLNTTFRDPYKVPSYAQSPEPNFGTKLNAGIQGFMNSPGMNMFKETSKFAVNLADGINEKFKDIKGRQAEQDMLKMSMADNMMGTAYDPNMSRGVYDTNTGLINKNMEGDASVSGGFAGYRGYGQDGMEVTEDFNIAPADNTFVDTSIMDFDRQNALQMFINRIEDGSFEPDAIPADPLNNDVQNTNMMVSQSVTMMQPGGEIPMYQNAGETSSFKPGDELMGGSDAWTEWYTSPQNEKGRKQRYETYKIIQKSRGVDEASLPSEEEFHRDYIKGERQINAIQEYYAKNNPEFLKRTDWDSSYKFDPKYKDAREALKAGAATKIGKNHRYKEALKAVNDQIKLDNPNATPEELKELQFEPLDDAGIRLFQGAYQAGQIYDLAGDAENYTDFVQSGVDDDTWSFDGKTYQASKIDGEFGNTSVGQREKTIVPEPQPEEVEEEQEIVEKRETPEVPDPVINKTAPIKAPYIQDIIKSQAIADRERDMFLPYQPPVRRNYMDVVLEDPTRQIAAINSQLASGQQAIGAFAGPQSMAARNAQQQGKAIDAIANAVGGVNQRNVRTLNQANLTNAQLDSQFNQLEDARNTKLYDDTMRTLQNYMNEKNYDREQYADSIANMITNMSNTYNLNQLYDYFNIDPLSGGDVVQTGDKAFQPNPEQDRWAFMKDYQEAVRQAKAAGLTDKDGNVDANFIKGIIDQSNARGYSDPREEAWKNQYRQSMASGAAGYRKGGEKKKKWATPFYTGKMGV